MDHFTNEHETYEKIHPAYQYFSLCLHANFRTKKTECHRHLNG